MTFRGNLVLPDNLPKNLSKVRKIEGKDNEWYRIENSTEREDETKITLYGSIGGWLGTNADEFVEKLNAITTAKINLHINSPGGSVFDGVAIHNALWQHPANVTVYVDSLAASIASVISLAGDELVMVSNSQFMIHDAMGITIGNAAEMREYAELLDMVSDNIASMYAEKAGGTAEEWRERMRDETWYTAQETVDAKLADKVLTKATKKKADASNNWDLSIFNFKGRESSPPPVTICDTAIGPHSTSVKEGTWSRSANEKRLPTPVPLGTARKFYTAYDDSAVEDGAIPKSAGHLPHHEVSSDGTPGAAIMSGVRAALARLNQVQGMSDAEKATAKSHLNAHLKAGGGTPDEDDDSEDNAGKRLADVIKNSFDLNFDSKKFAETLKGAVREH